jgi:hypothetical protein
MNMTKKTQPWRRRDGISPFLNGTQLDDVLEDFEFTIDEREAMGRMGGARYHAPEITKLTAVLEARVGKCATRRRTARR